MGRILNAKALAFTLCAVLLFSATIQASEQDEGEKASEQKGLQQRIDFGSSYILGQSIKSGAVYLMHRKKSEIKGMLDVREHYRNEILEDYALENTALAPATEKQQNSGATNRD
jgi:hypothetical protein